MSFSNEFRVPTWVGIACILGDNLSRDAEWDIPAPIRETKSYMVYAASVQGNIAQCAWEIANGWDPSGEATRLKKWAQRNATVQLY